MDLSAGFRAVSPTAGGAALVVLWRAKEVISGREIARRAGTSQSGMATAIEHLITDGLVFEVPGGYELNRDHVFSPAVEVLARGRAELFDRIRIRVEVWESGPLGVVVFGSAARGDGHVDSDIDLLLIRPDEVLESDPRWDREIEDLAHSIKRWTGNEAEIIDYSRTEAVAAHSDRRDLFVNIAADGIVLVGLSPAALAVAARSQER